MMSRVTVINKKTKEKEVIYDAVSVVTADIDILGRTIKITHGGRTFCYELDKYDFYVD